MLYNISVGAQEHESALAFGRMPPEGYIVCPPGPRTDAQHTGPIQLYGWGDQMHYRQDSRHSFSSSVGLSPRLDPQVKHEELVSPLAANEHPDGWPFHNYSFSPNPPASPPQEHSVEYPYIAGQKFPASASTVESLSHHAHRYSNDHSAGILTPPTATGSPFHDKEWTRFPPPPTEDASFPRPTQTSRPIESTSPVLVHRPDGVRKKNAKFEIPQERTVDNIDQLLKKAKDENTRKELKMQKRLLKNREAALQSRQRKKQHTENLEEQKKNLEAVMNRYGEDCDRYRSQIDELMEHNKHSLERESELSRRLEELRMENESLVALHKNETSELHKKINGLNTILENQGTPISTVPSSDSYDFSKDMDNLALGHPYWPPGEFFDDVCLDSEPVDARRQPSQTFTDFKLHSQSNELSHAGERLVVLLFLYGAYMASQSTPGAAFVQPNLPEDVQRASMSIVAGTLSGSSEDSKTAPAGIHYLHGSLEHGQHSPQNESTQAPDFFQEFLNRGSNPSTVAEFKQLLERGQC